MQTKRKVSFLPTVTVYPIAKLSGNEGEKTRLYYSRDEFNAISRDAKAIIKMHKELPTSGAFLSGIYTEVHNCIVGLHEDYSLCGLKLYLCPTRVINKLLTMNVMMKHQNALNTDSSVSEKDKIRSFAESSTKLSRRSQLVALETARLDLMRSR